MTLWLGLMAGKDGFGQTATGTISVVAEDSTQAVVPSATVTVTNKGTGLTRQGPATASPQFVILYKAWGECIK